MNTVRSVIQRKIQLRHFHKCFKYCQMEATQMPMEKMTIPVIEGEELPVTPKIEKLVKDITELNLIEVSQLSDILKKRLNLPDAPMMAMGNIVAPKSQDEDQVAQPPQTSFTVKLTKYGDTQKVAVIKEIKTLIPGINLVQAKKFVENLPADVKVDVTKEEAEQIKAVLVKAGAEVDIV